MAKTQNSPQPAKAKLTSGQVKAMVKKKAAANVAYGMISAKTAPSVAVQSYSGNGGPSTPGSVQFSPAVFNPNRAKPNKVQPNQKSGRKVKKTLASHGEDMVPEKDQRAKVSAGYAFVVKQGPDEETAEWRYVTFNYGTTLDVSLFPNMVFPQVTPRHHELWKRVVIDNAFDWDTGHVWPRTLRMVEVFLDVKDITPQLFIDDETYAHSRKLAALSKLTDEEARLLQCEQDFVFLKISQNKKRVQNDHNLADEIRSSLHHLGVR
ncbi:MAG: hypothetical protein EOP83_14310 [Verrucomicrobiaceae bacterium]|nr:MAG: hypothetical protein EOP83_14310 [Verrucomicrobiaceae bacterium]